MNREIFDEFYAVFSWAYVLRIIIIIIPISYLALHNSFWIVFMCASARSSHFIFF